MLLSDGINNNITENLLMDGKSVDDLTQLLDINSEALRQWLQNEWLQQNISQVLNISAENLTTLSERTHIYLHRDPLPLLTTLTTCYALIFIAGILGNLITCIVISRNKFMHTATNFYLFNLAISDLILLISGMPQEVYNLWYPNSYPFTDGLCILESVLSETAANATVLTITAFTVERYIAICHPFRQHTMSKLSRAIKFIFAIWITAFLLALPQAMQFSVEPESGGTECTMKNYLFKHVFVISGFIFFGGPMTAICVLYVLIGVKLKRSRLLQAVPRRVYDVHRGISAQSRVIRMLVAVAVAFFLCWAPFHTQRLMAVYGSIHSKIFNDIYYILNYTSGVLYFLSTCINPLLYNIMSHKFREAFKVTLARHFGLASTKSQSQSHNYCALIRQNGSMRLHTTVNTNNNNLSSYRLPLHNYREPNHHHHLSLQDSLRTTMTTTTTTSGGTNLSSGSNSCRSSIQRNRCLSMDSQSAVNASLNKAGNLPADNLPHRKLQKQISQLSSLGDANSLLEADDASVNCQQQPMATRKKNLRRSLIISNANNLKDGATEASHWHSESVDTRQRDAQEEETDLFAKPVAPLAPLLARQPLCLTPVNSVTDFNPNTRSRLKLTRIISRRNRDMYEVQASPRAELIRAHLPGMGNSGEPVKAKTAKNKTTNGLVERFRWRTQPTVDVKHENGALIVTPSVSSASAANIPHGSRVSRDSTTVATP